MMSIEHEGKRVISEDGPEDFRLSSCKNGAAVYRDKESHGRSKFCRKITSLV